MWFFFLRRAFPKRGVFYTLVLAFNNSDLLWVIWKESPWDKMKMTVFCDTLLGCGSEFLGWNKCFHYCARPSGAKLQARQENMFI